MLYEHLYYRCSKCAFCGVSLKPAMQELRMYWVLRGLGKKRNQINIDIDHAYPRSKNPGVHPFFDVGGLRLSHKSCNSRNGNQSDYNDYIKHLERFN